jgi:hypothetical protein
MQTEFEWTLFVGKPWRAPSLLLYKHMGSQCASYRHKPACRSVRTP